MANIKRLVTHIVQLFFKFLNPQLNSSEYWLWGISPEGIGFVGMLLNLLVSNLLRLITPKTPIYVKEMVDNIRQP